MKKVLIFLGVWGCLALPLGAVSVVTTTTDLADITRQVGGQYVSVESLTSGNQDPHQVDARPSMVLKVRRADLVVMIGMDLDGWIRSILETSRNPGLSWGSSRVIDVSAAIPEKLEIPSGYIDGSRGDIHLYGNPHYLLDPENGIRAARLLAKRLAQLDPDHQGYFQQRLSVFESSMRTVVTKWKTKIKQRGPVTVVSYHDGWPYFAKAFGWTIVDTIETKPGIPPSAKHLVELKQKMKQEKVTAVLIEPWHDLAIAKKVAESTGATLIIGAPCVGSFPSVKTYQDVFEYTLSQLR